MVKKKICLDAGHYGKINQCPAIPEYYESEHMWMLHKLLKKHLEALGFEVILTRDTLANDMALTQRGKKAAGCDLFISLHSNATGTYTMNESVDYTVAIVPLNGSSDDIGEKMAETVAKTMGVSQGSRISKRYYDENNKDLDYYGVIRGAVSVGVPCMILEHSFHTNTRVVHWLMNYDNLDKLARAEANTIGEHFGVIDKEVPTKIDKLDGTLRVIYQGVDGVNVHNTPDFNESSINYTYGPVGPATKHGSNFTVTGIATLGDGSKMYRLLSGLYITAHKTFVEFAPAEEKVYVPWFAKVVDTEALNVRRTPNGEPVKVIHSVKVVGEEPDKDGDIWYKVQLGDGTTGYVWPKYLSK